MGNSVGLVGVGTMGTQMLRALRSAGYAVVARDIDPEAEARARSLGAETASSPADVARQADVILLSLPSPAEVAEVFYGRASSGRMPLPGLMDGARAGQVIVDLSTVDPFSTRANHGAAAGQGVAYLDAPVLGRPSAVGRWTLPVGGSEAALEKARPVLQTFAERVIWVGESGSGNIVKLLNNLMFGAINAVTSEILSICAAMGLDPAVFFDTVASSGAATVSKLFLELVPKMLDRDFSPTFKMRLLHKDMQLGIEMAKRARVPTPISGAVQMLNEIALCRGLHEQDTSALVQVFEEWARARVVRRK